MKTLAFLYENAQTLSELVDKKELDVQQDYIVRIYSAIASSEEAVAMARTIKSAFPRAGIIGCSASGIVCNDVQHDDKTLVIFESYDKAKATIRSFVFSGKPLAEVSAEVAAFAVENGARLMHLLTSSAYKEIHGLVVAFNKLSPETKLVGGIAGDVLAKNVSSYVFDENGIQEMMALSLTGDGIHVNNWVNIGHETISEKFTLTEVDDSVWKTVDDMPAEAWLREQLGLPEFKEHEEWDAIAQNDEIIRFPMVLEEYHSASRFLRYNSEKKGLTHYFDRTPEKTGFRIAYTNPNSVINRTYEIFREISRQPVEQIFSYSCLFRKLYMNNCSEWELMPYRGYGLCGAFMMGEIGSIEGLNVFLEGSCSLVTMAENEVYIRPDSEAFQKLNVLSDDTAKLLNYVSGKKEKLLTRNNEKLLQELLAQNEASKENLYVDRNTGLHSYIQYKADRKTCNYDKLCMIKLDNEDALMTYLGQTRFMESTKKRARLVANCIDHEKYRDNLRVYALSDDKIFIAANGGVNKEDFRQLAQEIFAVAQFIPLDGSNGSGEIMINRFILVLDEERLVDSALNALHANQLLQIPFLVCQASDRANLPISQEFRIIGVLNRALKNNRIIPYFQGIHDNRTNRVEKYEALMRLVDIDGTVYYPSQFMDTAKKYHLYNTLSRIMLKQVFELFRNRKESVSFNFSAFDINSSEMRQIIYDLLEEIGDCSNFVLEILEDEQFNDIDQLNEFIAEIRRYGMKIAIDDFGSGYSNFLEIMEIQPDFIKIDGKIISTLHSKEISRKIVDVVQFMGMRFNIELIAEFVENEEIQNHVRFKQISYSQGYYFSRPQPFEALGI